MLSHASKKSHFSMINLMWLIPSLVLSLFLLVGLLTNPLVKGWVYMDPMNQALSSLSAESLVEVMGSENPSFISVLPKDYSSFHFSKVALQMVTHINIEDERSLLGNELPGFSQFDTRIVVAGQGTNYTNMPNESTPSIDYVLQQQQQDINQTQTKSADSTNQNQPDANKPSTSDVQGAKILIYSTHSWENYLPLLGLTGDPDANKAVGSGTPDQGVHLVDTWLKKDLTDDGVPTDVNYQDAAKVLHAKNWNTNQAYDASRPIVEAAVKSGKPYQLYIDIHRDSSRKNLTTVQINNQSYARVSFVIGKGDPHYAKNEVIATDLHQALDNQYPGLSRGIFEKTTSEGNGVYNQDLSTHAILIEIGGVDNNETELKNTVSALSTVISAYIKKLNAQ